jgi:hypothetical protein
MGGRRKRMLEPHRAFIVERIAQTSHRKRCLDPTFRVRR